MIFLVQFGLDVHEYIFRGRRTVSLASAHLFQVVLGEIMRLSNQMTGKRKGDQAWKLIPLRLLSGVGGTLLFQCNYDIKYLNLSADLPAFYKGVISHWQELNNAIPTTKKDVSDQIVWNNRFIKINKTSAFIRSWH